MMNMEMELKVKTKCVYTLYNKIEDFQGQTFEVHVIQRVLKRMCAKKGKQT